MTPQWFRDLLVRFGYRRRCPRCRCVLSEWFVHDQHRMWCPPFGGYGCGTVSPWQWHAGPAVGKPYQGYWS